MSQNVYNQVQKYVIAKKIPVNVENACVWGFKLKLLNFYFCKQFFLFFEFWAAQSPKCIT